MSFYQTPPEIRPSVLTYPTPDRPCSTEPPPLCWLARAVPARLFFSTSTDQLLRNVGFKRCLGNGRRPGTTLRYGDFVPAEPSFALESGEHVQQSDQIAAIAIYPYSLEMIFDAFNAEVF